MEMMHAIFVKRYPAVGGSTYANKTIMLGSHSVHVGEGAWVNLVESRC
jgi:hypothetical protein